MFAGRCSASGSGAVLKTPAASCIVASSVRLSQDLERKLCQQDWCESATCCMLEIDGFQSVGTLSSVASFRRAGAPKTLARLRVPATQRVRSRFLMESSLRGSLGSSGSGSSVADSVLKQLASLEQSLSSNLAGLRQIQATVAAMEGTGKPETQSQRVARSRIFELITFVILASNAIWTGQLCVEIEVNDAPIILQAHAAVILIESFFVLYFTLEIGLRFGAFKRRRRRECMHAAHMVRPVIQRTLVRSLPSAWLETLTCDACRDGWFAFDTVLVILMWFETWLLSLVQIFFGDISNSSSFRLIRLLRLTRMARMARLLRSVPELLIIVRAIAIALRSVFFLMVLPFGLVYVFALLFSQLFDGKNQPPGLPGFQL
eukprot:s2732_g4.t1